jgi:hypothetical protein
MTTVRIYKSPLLDARMKVRYGRKHGMPRGRGSKRWRLIDRVKWRGTLEPSASDYVSMPQPATTSQKGEPDA